MIKNRKLLSPVIFVLVSAMLMNSLGVLPFYASGNDIQVTATTNASVKQGNSGYCYVYIDSLESLSSLSVTVHYDPEKISVSSSSVYNSVSCTIYDKAVGETNVKFSYIFDGKGESAKTQLFYFRYTVLSDAEVGDTYFDIVVNEAYDSSVKEMSVSGSRCSLTIAETVTTKTCSIYSSSSVSTSVGEEFELSYRLSTYQISSGSFVINYDPEFFEVVSISKGTFFDNKIVDVNTNLSGAVYVSFAGTEYSRYTDLITVKFKTLQNVAEISTVKFTVTEFYDLELNPTSCNGYTTNATVVFDETYTEDAPNMTLQAIYDASTDKLTLTIKLDKDSMLGAGDFILTFDTSYLTYVSATKGFSPTFFNINNKNVTDGILKFSIISLSDITDEQTVLTAVFDVKHACEDKNADFEISGSGLVDSLTKAISLNFVDTSVTIPFRHTEATYGWNDSYHWSICACTAVVEDSYEVHRFGDDGTVKTCNDCGYQKNIGVNVSGTITSFRKGEGDITVQVFSGEEIAYSTVINTYSGTSAFTSEYSIPGVVDGTYTLRVSKANHVTRDYTVTVNGEDFTKNVVIFMLGDITMDGSVDILDHQALFEHLQGIKKITDDYQMKLANTKDDNAVDILDHQCLFEHLQGIKSFFN